MSAILWARFKGLRNQKMSLLAMFILPIVFTFFFSLGNLGGEPVLPVVVEEEDKLSEQLVLALTASEERNVERIERSELEEGLLSNRYEAGWVITTDTVDAIKNSERTIPISMLRMKDTGTLTSLENELRTVALDVANYYQLTQTIEQEFEGVAVTASLNQEYVNEKSITVETRALENEGGFTYDQTFQALVGFTLFFTMYTIVFTLGELLEDETKLILQRVRISPVSTLSIYGANFVYSFLVGFIQLFLLVLTGRYLFNIDWGPSFWGVLLVMAVYTVAVMGIGMVLCAISKTMQQLSAFTPVVAVSTAMLGGAYWPIEIIQNEWLIRLATITPIYHAMDALKEIVLQGNSVLEIWPQLFVLMLTSLFLFIIGITLFSKFKIART
ncbi:hypothetical protein N781_03235 [Pontibacillus halophilus JSM 076056 = DSM 19796]|uniref:ABC transmembrane type-2 domain-containing protein n=1 Tax=Pontibacillus halophilus JSM 076056 = DSM 19796 TaxID=1385510 RepID=A0A0A5GLJ1_9BACI|nr:ABC transporter permease [Pontibacillus halophilus]KGX92088.1 hypothetical protein N781_03235 [Pontibacillus halophilus JSM 076056 = DSM 19796]